MSQEYKIDDLQLPANSEVLRLVNNYTDIDPIQFIDQEYLMNEGEPGKDIFLVLKGSFLVERDQKISSNQPSPPIAIVNCTPESPSFVGEMAYFGGKARVASVKSAAATYTLRLKPDHLDTIISEYQVLTRCICRQFTKRLGEANETVQRYQQLLHMEMTQSFFNPGEVIFSKGEKADTLCQLIDGTVIRETSTGAEIITMANLNRGIIEPGPFFRNGNRQSSLRAENQCIIVNISNRSMPAIVRNFPEVALQQMAS